MTKLSWLAAIPQIALHPAKGGNDVAITARTVSEGESREHSSTVKQSNSKPLSGSLNSTAESW